jgi:hypothetical protein
MLRGGDAIAAGSDGCVFDGTFAPDGTFTKDAARVTKVYHPAVSDVAANEWAAMELVIDATDGSGVVVAEGAPSQIAKVPDDAWGDKLVLTSACEKLKKANEGDVIMAMVLPKIDGTVGELQKTLDASAFAELKGAVGDLAARHICHMDFAARNIFYKTEAGVPKLLLGDFGNTFKVVGGDFDTRVQGYVKRYDFRGKFLASAKIDGVHPLAVAFLVLYDALLAGKATYDALLDDIRKNELVKKTIGLAEATWVVKRLRVLADRASDTEEEMRVIEAVERFSLALAERFKTILQTFAGEGRSYEDASGEKSKTAIKALVQKNLKRSDPCLLDILILTYQKDAITGPNFDAIIATWFPDPSKKTGGKKRRGGEAAIHEAASLEEALTTPTPDLATDTSTIDPINLPMDEALAMIGGRHRGQKTRRKRVKMSRRK